ncbi:MAG: ATP-dependent Clp protease ATP-binding subunit [Planctomycetes bacterium]|nr:ATP-dependent Clp protease ATP-binding subunit [Planctomycetota bacterium]
MGLAEAVSHQPAGVVLFSDIDKAPKGILEELLQALDGRSARDSRGQPVAFSNTIIIMVSNIGDRLLSECGENAAESKSGFRAKALADVRSTLPGDLLDRVERIVDFPPLTILEAEEVVERWLDEIRVHFWDDVTGIEVDEEARRHLALSIWRPGCGCSLEEAVRYPLHCRIRSRELRPGSRIRIVLSDGQD